MTSNFALPPTLASLTVAGACTVTAMGRSKSLVTGPADRCNFVFTLLGRPRASRFEHLDGADDLRIPDRVSVNRLDQSKALRQRRRHDRRRGSSELFHSSNLRGGGSEPGRMSGVDGIEVPSGHTPEGGVLVGSQGARRRLVVFEDPQCPYCREFEDVSGDRLRREVAAGAVAVEYRVRSFLGDESVRAANALAAAAQADGFDELRRQIFANQPPEHSGGFTTEGLLELGRRAGLTGTDFVAAVTQGRYERWVREIEEVFEDQDPHGTPFAVLDGQPVEAETLYDPDALGALIGS